jgi:hypothetical protein
MVGRESGHKGINRGGEGSVEVSRYLAKICMESVGGKIPAMG